MPATIRSSAEFSSGNPVLTSHTTNVAPDGFVEVRMSFACLESALRSNLARFRMEATPPSPLPSDVAALPLETGALYLNAIASTTEKGIGYIEATFVGCSLDQKKRITETRSQRSFSGRYQVLRINTTGNANPSLVNVPITFDYTAQAFTVAWSAIGEAPAPILEPTIIEVRNLEENTSFLTSSTSYTLPAGRSYDIKLVEELSITPVGPVKRYVKTVVAVAESNASKTLADLGLTS
jgi:hypothetical protein